MPLLNIEIKTRTSDPSVIRNYLKNNKAEFAGIDMQTDTYFNVRRGRLKLREGNIETNLIYYERNTVAGPKSSLFHLIKVPDTSQLKAILEYSLGIKVVVRKEREIYFIKNVKFHIDYVPRLGNFVEVEAGNLRAAITEHELRQQCEFYVKELGIKNEDLIAESYSDMILKIDSISAQ